MKPKPRSNSSRSSGKSSGKSSRKSSQRLSATLPLQNQRARVVRCIRALPPGNVSSYGAVAKAAGWPGAARQIVRILQQVPGLPWHRVLGAGGAIKLRGEHAAEQIFRLRMEGVTFRGVRVDMKRHEFRFAKKVPSTQYPVTSNRQRRP